MRPGVEELAPRAKVWLERGGRIVFSDYRARLLEHIVESGSLAEAAQQMGLSYRRAWGKVREMEQNLGVALVRGHPGGRGGGRTELTPTGQRLLELYRRFREAAAGELEREFAAIFGHEIIQEG